MSRLRPEEDMLYNRFQRWAAKDIWSSIFEACGFRYNPATIPI